MGLSHLGMQRHLSCIMSTLRDFHNGTAHLAATRHVLVVLAAAAPVLVLEDRRGCQRAEPSCTFLAVICVYACLQCLSAAAILACVRGSVPLGPRGAGTGGGSSDGLLMINNRQTREWLQTLSRIYPVGTWPSPDSHAGTIVPKKGHPTLN